MLAAVCILTTIAWVALRGILRRTVLTPARRRPARPHTRHITSVPSDGVPVICARR